MQCSSNGNRALCSRIIDPLSRLPAGQFPPTSHSSSLPPHRRCIVGFSQHKPQLPFDPALTCTDWVILFFLYVITISAWFCPAGGSDEHTAAGHTVMQHPLLDRWWATHSWHRRKPTNQCDLGSSHPADWLWFLWKSQDVKAYWNLFFLGDSYCFSVSTLLSTEVFTPLSSLTLTWIRWWVCKLRVFFLFACLFLCREISKWAKMLQDKPQDIHIHSAYWLHVWGRSNNSKYQDLNTEVQNGLNQQKFSHRNTILISENKPVLKKETKLNLK